MLNHESLVAVHTQYFLMNTNTSISASFGIYRDNRSMSEKYM